MQRASSFSKLSSRPAAGMSRSPSVRAIYINEETSKRAVNTHFHSPFKDGRPNKDYVNPSFISTHLLYPKEMLQKEQVDVRQNYIPNENDRKKEELYRQRINTEMNEQRAIRQRIEKIAKAKEAMKSSLAQPKGGPKLIDSEQGLKNELNSLQNYRLLQTSQIKPKKEDAVPPYFQKQRKDHTVQVQQQEAKQRTLREFMHTNQRESNIRREQTRRQAEKENMNMQKNIDFFNKKTQERGQLARNKSSLLGNILKEQMLLRQQSKTQI